MSDRFQPLTTEQLAGWVFDELDVAGTIFGIPAAHFFRPRPEDRFALTLYGQRLETPFGVAAGPHSQMAQNIVAGWLCGARFIELKTVQTLDEIEVSKPCIDMRDEGYNIEWSQELTVDQSIEEYLRAWVLIHALHRRLELPGEAPGVIFNMSVGYDLAGIQKPNVQRFLEQMTDASAALGPIIDVVAQRAPELRQVEVPTKVSDNVTVSTMHGCPPEEVSKICAYLIERWSLHTNVKLNPTLLGPERVRHIINEALGFSHITVPDEAFGHDLKYDDAVELITALLETGRKKGVEFGVKLCNSLEVVNHGRAFTTEQSAMMYMSGRPHHAVAVNVAEALSREFDGALPMSFAGGVDTWNVVDLLCSGMTTVTTCSDILRPGGYGRLLQYIEGTAEALEAANAADLEELTLTRATAALPDAPPADAREAAQRNLARYAAAVIDEPRLKRDTFERQQTKTKRPLGPFDCILAPCIDTCPISQQVPRYIELIKAGDPAGAAEVVREDNVMGAVLGRACTHACEQTCTRVHYDEPVAIRELKRFAMDHERAAGQPAAGLGGGAKVAVIGAGPCGLSAAYFLGRAGLQVTLFESAPVAGGMVSGSIPAYRATQRVLDQDLSFLEAAGVTLELNQEIGDELTVETLRSERGFDAVVAAAGARRGQPLQIPAEEGPGVHDGLDFLRAARRGEALELGSGAVGVIGGGDVAMDCARTAARLAPGRVRLIYRRTIEQMPAHREELEGLLEEGIEVAELLSPVAVIRGDDGHLTTLECTPMKLGEPDASGRRRPVPISDETVELPLSALIVAIGQRPDFGLLGDLEPRLSPAGYLAVDPETLETSIAGLYAGGDLIEGGPETIVKALGDGKKIARAIAIRFGRPHPLPEAPVAAGAVDLVELWRERSLRTDRQSSPKLPADERSGFEEIVKTLSVGAAKEEAARCLRCDLLCSVCASVCPNRAFTTYRATPLRAELPLVRAGADGLERVGEQLFEVAQSFQVAVLTDLCNECGNCATFCPTAGRPYQDKPRLYVDLDEFSKAQDNAYRLVATDSGTVISARIDGELHELTLGDRLEYRSPQLEATLEPESLEVLELRAGSALAAGQSASLEVCARLFILASSLNDSADFLPRPRHR